MKSHSQINWKFNWLINFYFCFLRFLSYRFLIKNYFGKEYLNNFKNKKIINYYLESDLIILRQLKEEVNTLFFLISKKTIFLKVIKRFCHQ